MCRGVEVIHPITYTEEELACMREVRSCLIDEHGVEESRIGLGLLALTTINCKLRVEEAASKYKKVLDILALCGVPEGVDDNLWKEESAHELRHYQPVGTSHEGSSIIWITGDQKPPSIEQERDYVLAGLMYFMAVHADSISLRNGVHFVLDMTNKSSEKVGNEAKLQKLHQSFPMRPKAILIAGSNTLTRVVVNSTIAVASLFTKQKILDRIRFITVEEAIKSIPISSAPKRYGGNGGGHDSMQDWVKRRLENFPIPEL